MPFSERSFKHVQECLSKILDTAEGNIVSILINFFNIINIFICDFSKQLKIQTIKNIVKNICMKYNGRVISNMIK